MEECIRIYVARRSGTYCLHAGIAHAGMAHAGMARSGAPKSFRATDTPACRL